MQYRHGDVLLVSTNENIEDGWKQVAKGRAILAEGEVTGHAHVVSGDVQLLERDSKRLLFVEAPASLTHEEHATINVAPGMYFVMIQREYTPQEIRNVAD